MSSMDASEVKQLAKKGSKERLEMLFLEAWRRLFRNLPHPTMQHRFHPVRKWRWDFSWNEEKLAVEIQGGSYIHGGHNRAGPQQKDYEKQRAAVSMGWRVLPFNTADMRDPDAVVTEVAMILTNAKDVKKCS